MTEQTMDASLGRPAGARSNKPTGKPKSEVLRRLLLRPNGATVAQLQKQLGWQPHTVRAAISRLRSNGVSVDLDRSGRVARYRLSPGEDQ